MMLATCLALGLTVVQEKEPPKAQELLQEALKKAKEEKKAVLLTFGSPG